MINGRCLRGLETEADVKCCDWFRINVFSCVNIIIGKF